MRVSRLSPIAFAAALPLALAGCSSSAASSASAGTSGAASSAAGSANSGAALLTGSRLKTALVTTGIPSGYTVYTSGTQDSGSSYQSPSAASTAKPDCTQLEGTSWVNLAGYKSVSFAQNDYLNKASSEEFLQEVDAYEGSTAQTVMTNLAKLSATCPSFTDSSTNSTVKVAVATGTSLGDGTVTITLTDAQWGSSETLVAVRVGQNVISVLNSATGNSATYADTLASAITAGVKKLG
jgi:hypothetical protein